MQMIVLSICCGHTRAYSYLIVESFTTARNISNRSDISNQLHVGKSYLSQIKSQMLRKPVSLTFTSQKW